MGPAFTFQRLRALCRLTGYTLISEYLLILLLAALPFNPDPSRLFGLIGIGLETASMPVLALPLLFIGFSQPLKPARWEIRFAKSLRWLCLIVAILFLLLIPASLYIGSTIRSDGDQLLQQQEAQAQVQILRFQDRMAKASSTPELRLLVEANPQLRESLAGSDSPFHPRRSTLDQQRAQAERLYDRVAINLKDRFLQQRSDSSGQLFKEVIRLCSFSLLNATYFAFCFLIWPSHILSLPVSPTSYHEE